MEYNEYIVKKEQFYEYFLCFIDEENQIGQYFEELIEIITKNKYDENPEEFKTILYLISEISKNHHRSSTFLAKIERIISHYSEFIKRSFNKHELFKIFKKNPQILLFLFNSNIITVDDSILKLLLKGRNQAFVIRKFDRDKKIDYGFEKRKHFNKKSVLQNYKYYFIMNIQSMLEEEELLMIGEELFQMNENILDDFEKKCQIGENDSYISEIIREDNVKEFIVYTNKINLHLNSVIKSSIFETNPFLVQRQSTLIEYAAFFGSIQIFNYLRMNKVELTPSLWLYAIHGNNPDIIHILENNHVEPSDKTYKECLKESIKCHHNEIAHYIESNFINEKCEMNESNLKDNPISYGYHYYNYEFIQDSKELSNFQILLFYACLYDHSPIVEILINTKKVSCNQAIIRIIDVYKAIFIILIMEYLNDISKMFI